MSKRSPSPAGARDKGPSSVRIGARLRAARTAQRMTIETVAGKTGLTKGFISRLERDEASPSVASLVAVCEAIDLRVGDLFDPPQTAVVRAGEGRPIAFGTTGVTELLLTPGTQQQLEVIHSVMVGGGQGGQELYSLDCDTEFVYVVDGTLEVVLEDQVVSLGTGDAMTFPGRSPHTWRNGSSDQRCEVIWALSPSP